MNKNTPLPKLDFDIDYELFKADEIIHIYNFFNFILKNEQKPQPINELKKAYQKYRHILRNVALEKKYDALFLKATGLSIYHIMKNL